MKRRRMEEAKIYVNEMTVLTVVAGDEGDERTGVEGEGGDGVVGAGEVGEGGQTRHVQAGDAIVAHVQFSHVLATQNTGGPRNRASLGFFSSRILIHTCIHKMHNYIHSYIYI